MADRHELRRAYTRVFESEEGRLILDDLRAQFYDVPLYPEADYRAGRHDVILHIIEQTKRGADQ